MSGHVIAYSCLDRCGNNWLNGKGCCGILMVREASQTVTTAFSPWVLAVRQSVGVVRKNATEGVLGGKYGE